MRMIRVVVKLYGFLRRTLNAKCQSTINMKKYALEDYLNSSYRQMYKRKHVLVYL